MPGRKFICRVPDGLISILQAAASAASTLSPLQLSPILATPIPLHGTYVGFPSDHLGMEVQVSVMSGTPEVIWTARQPAASRRFGQST